MTGELSSLARTATSAVPIETDPWRILAVAESDGNTGIESKEGLWERRAFSSWWAAASAAGHAGLSCPAGAQAIGRHRPVEGALLDAACLPAVGGCIAL